MDQGLDNSIEKPKWGGVRPGSGRPKGSMNQDSIMRREIKKAFQERVAKNADRLFNAQFNLATGEQYLMWKHKVGSGTKERTVVEVVDDPEIIKSYLDETLEQDGDEFYFISTKPANGMAIDSMLDRAFGRAESKLDVTSDGEKINSSPADATLVDAFIAGLKNESSQRKPD